MEIEKDLPVLVALSACHLQGDSVRAAWTSLSDEQLLAQCEVDTYRASGPGGQKRNKTSSAVRLRHRPSGLIVIAEESRSQHETEARVSEAAELLGISTGNLVDFLQADPKVWQEANALRARSGQKPLRLSS